MKKILLFLVLFVLASCKFKSMSYDTEAAINEAINFSKKAFILLDYNATQMLTEDLKSQFNEKSFLELVSKMHPLGTPNYIKNLTYIPDIANQSIIIIIEARNNIDTYYYSISVELKNETKKINGFRVFNNLQYQKIQNSGVMECPKKNIIKLKDIPTSEYTAELEQQNKRKEILYNTGGQFQTIRITEKMSIRLENITQIYYEAENGWLLIFKYRTDKNIDDIKSIEKDGIYYFENNIKNKINNFEIEGVVILAVENKDYSRSKSVNRKQYGITFTKDKNNVLIRNKKTP